MNWLLYDGIWVQVDTRNSLEVCAYKLDKPISIPKEVYFPPDLYKRLKGTEPDFDDSESTAP